jgi:hypothetical protein
LVNFYQTTRCYNPEDSNLRPCVGSKVTGSVRVGYGFKPPMKHLGRHEKSVLEHNLFRKYRFDNEETEVAACFQSVQ